MDPRIASLKSTTFCGRRLTRRQIADVQETVALSPALSRNELAKTVCELAAAHDRQWMQRKRILDSLIVVLFVFRLVLSRGDKGYATVLAELWDQCRKLGIALPQREPVAASSICKARARVHEDLFLDLHREILRHGGSGQWKGHRTFAVDGTRMNLPRPLAKAGYPLPHPAAHYPQGLVSCLYRLDTGTPVDFSLSADYDERAAALVHLDAVEPGDIVVFDRGYFSFMLLYALVWRGAHPVFRLSRNSAFDDFIDGDRDDATVSAVPKKNQRARLRAAFPGRRFDPVDLRLLRCCFETALERIGERRACRLTVAPLALAHEENCEAELAAAIGKALKAGRLPDPDKLKARFAPDRGSMPSIHVARPLLAGYGDLLDAGGAA